MNRYLGNKVIKFYHVVSPPPAPRSFTDWGAAAAASLHTKHA